MQRAGSSLIEFYGPMVQTSNALSTSYYMTSNPSFTFYNKRYRTPLQDRDGSFNILEDDEDLLTFTAMDMGNSGGTKRRCMLCPQHFNLLNRKHHCRACGWTVCEGCSSNYLTLDQWLDSEKPHRMHTTRSEEPLRVCQSCFVYVPLEAEAARQLAAVKFEATGRIEYCTVPVEKGVLKTAKI